jgi:MFS family permease
MMTEAAPATTQATCIAVPAAKPYTLGRRASFWVAGAVVGHTLWTSAAPALTYQLYAAAWHLSHAVTTAIFAIYPIVVVAVLIGCGDISDHIGRRETMLIGLAASAAGTLCFALAPGVAWLFAGRILMGVGVGLTASPSTAAMVEFSRPGQEKMAGAIAASVQAAGFAAALLLGGLLIQAAPWPMHLSFWVLFALLAALFATVWFLPRHRQQAGGTGWQPRLPYIPAKQRGCFVLAAAAVTTAYTHGVLILSLGGQLLHDLVGSPNAFVNGAALSLFPIFSGVTGIVAKKLPYRTAMASGAAASAAGMGLFMAAVAGRTLPVFLLGTATSGIGYGLLFTGGLQLINATTPDAHRGAVLSALYLCAYLSLGLVAQGLGLAATLWSLKDAIDLGAGIMMLFSLVVLGLVVLKSQQKQMASEGSTI